MFNTRITGRDLLLFEEKIERMWLYESVDNIDLKVNKALHKAKIAIMDQNRSDLSQKSSINAAGQQAINADEIAEKEFLEVMIDQNINGVLYSEESGVIRFGDPEEDSENSIMFLIDPLDGSQNYLRGLPFGCISVAYGSFKENPTLKDLNKASILNLYADELFYAKKGVGAYFNGDKITSDYEQLLHDSPNTIQISYYAYGSNASRYFFDFQEIYSLRSLGSAAWELALVANNRNDAFADIRGVLKTHDFAAAKIILEEVGGKFDFLSTNGYFSPDEIPLDDFTSGYSIIASKNEILLNKMLTDFKEHGLV